MIFFQINLVKHSNATKRYLHLPVALGKGLSMSMPQVANGKGLMMDVRGVIGHRWTGVNF